MTLSIWRSASVRLQVRPQVSARTTEERLAPELTVRVTNLSPFALTIERAIIVSIDGSRDRAEFQLERVDGNLPIDLQPRSAATFRLPIRTTIAIATKRLDYAQVETACGVVCKSSRWHPLKGKTLGTMLQAQSI